MIRRVALALALAATSCRAAEAEAQPAPAPAAVPAPARGTEPAVDDAAAHAPAAAPCADGGALTCTTYERYVNHKFGFSVDVPAVFVKKPPDADGRGQPFDYGSKARVRAWAMYDNPPMTVQQLYGDWTRRDGITFKTIAMNTWVVRGREQGRLFYSRSILADGIICTVEVSYASDLAEAFEPLLLRMGSSLMTIEGEGVRARARGAF
ncbi:MAG TPA: hypothetical protein VIF15_04055 [Polyangiaceae bacterium]|jgi:hypothetical protein